MGRSVDIEKHEKWLSLFTRWTKESAYYYGILLGDGHISDVAIYLGCQYEICKGFYTFLGIDREPRKHSKAKIYTCIVHSKYLTKWFRDRDIPRKKSNHLPWPIDIPDNLIWHFIRGLIDTDGSVTLATSRHGKKTLCIRYSSMCEPFIKIFSQKLNVNYVSDNKIIENNNYFQYCIKLSESDSIKYGELIYKDSNGLRFSDKYNRYLEGVSIYNVKQINCECGKPFFTNGKCMECFWKERDQNKDKICSIEGCNQIVNKQGLCCSHYHKERRIMQAQKEGRVLIPRTRKKG